MYQAAARFAPTVIDVYGELLVGGGRRVRPGHVVRGVSREKPRTRGGRRRPRTERGGETA
jgi:hypothetical protein